MRNTALTATILWALAAASAASLFANIALGLSIPIAVVLSLAVAFALVHGAVRYGWRGVAAKSRAVAESVRSWSAARDEQEKRIGLLRG